MNFAIYIAVLLLFATGIAHSVLGERYILIRLFRREDLPKLFGGMEFTKRTLRFAWHITMIAWWGFAALLILVAQDQVSRAGVGWIISITSFITGAMVLAISRARHLAWIVFFAVGGIVLAFTLAP